MGDPSIETLLAGLVKAVRWGSKEDTLAACVEAEKALGEINNEDLENQSATVADFSKLKAKPKKVPLEKT